MAKIRLLVAMGVMSRVKEIRENAIARGENMEGAGGRRVDVMSEMRPLVLDE